MYKSFFLIVLFTNIACAESEKFNSSAPEQTKQFVSMLGEWKISDSSLGKDGKWTAGYGADWNWYTILDGNAIQDDWIQPSLNIKLKDKSKRQFGTNIRIYNPKKNQWEMAWASNGGKKVDTFTAVGIDGKVVMSGFYAGNNTRITFYDMKKNTFEWKMEIQSKEDKTVWKEIYRIHGDRKK